MGRDGVKEDSRSPQSLLAQRHENALASFNDGSHLTRRSAIVAAMASTAARGTTAVYWRVTAATASRPAD
jgi:hypothetical protein